MSLLQIGHLQLSKNCLAGVLDISRPLFNCQFLNSMNMLGLMHAFFG